MYNGKGAKVIDRPVDAAESPPSYDEVTLFSPLLLAGASTQRATQMEEMLVTFQTKLITQWEEQLDQWLGETTRAMQDQFIEQLGVRLAQTWDDIPNKTHERDEQAKDEMNNHLDYVIDKKLAGIKIDMQSFVKDEMADVDEKIRLDISDGIRQF